MKITTEMRNITSDLMKYLDESSTAAFAVRMSEDLLKKEGFKEYEESEKWSLKKGDKFYVKRGKTAITAGIIGEKSPCESGFRVIGSHTDSPGFRVKSNGVYEKDGYIQLAVEVYGGPIFASWTDRDLTFAGQIVYEEKGFRMVKLWKGDRPFARIANLPIHMNREVNDKGMVLDPQKHLDPILALGGKTEFKMAEFKAFLAKESGLPAGSILGFDLELVDVQKAATFGINKEFFVSSRIDNLMMSHASLMALTKMKEIPETTSLAILFDNEEIGSATLNGGQSPMLENILERIAIATGGDREDLLRAMAQSIVLSADGAHAVHPNYDENWEPLHFVYLNKGPVIKINAKQRYAGNAETTVLFEECCKKAKVPCQKYIHRNDKPCGSTIGPITATRTGMLTLDVGHPMVSMHSIREMAGVADQYYMIQAMKEFYKIDK